MERSALANAIVAYFNPIWVGAHSTVEAVYPNITRKQTPDPAAPTDSSWLRVTVMDVDGPNQETYGGTMTSRGHVLFQMYTPLDVGSGYGEELVDAAIVILRGKRIGEIEFLPKSETFLGYEDESKLWWMSMGRVPFWVPDDTP